MMEERPRTRSVTKTVRSETKTARSVTKTEAVSSYHVLHKIRENDRHYGEHEITKSDWDPSNNDRKRSGSSSNKTKNCETAANHQNRPKNEQNLPKNEIQSPLDDSEIELKAVDQVSKEYHFRIKMSTKLEFLKKSYAKSVKLPVSPLKFIFRDQRINDNDTPSSLQMKKDDVIEVYWPIGKPLQPCDDYRFTQNNPGIVSQNLLK